MGGRRQKLHDPGWPRVDVGNLREGVRKAGRQVESVVHVRSVVRLISWQLLPGAEEALLQDWGGFWEALRAAFDSCYCAPSGNRPMFVLILSGRLRNVLVELCLQVQMSN